MSCSLVVTCWERADFLARSPVCDVLLCIYHFHIRYPGSGVVFDLCILPYVIIIYGYKQSQFKSRSDPTFDDQGPNYL